MDVESFDSANVLRQLFAIIDASTWAESRRIIDSYPAVVTINADAILLGFVTHAENLGYSEVAASLKQVSTLLERCRDVGCEAAFAEMARGDVKIAAKSKEFLARLANGV